MMRRPDQAGGAGSEVPEEHAELADRVTRHLLAQSFDPAVRARHLHQLRELAATQPLPRPVRSHVGPLWRGLGRRVVGTAAASLAAIALSVSAMAAASQSALPGEPLYGTKLLVERVQRATALTKEGKVATVVDQAHRRVEEVGLLLQQDADPERVEVALEAVAPTLREAEMIAGDDPRLNQQVAMGAGGAAVALGELGSQVPESDPASREMIETAMEDASVTSARASDASQAAPAGGLAAPTPQSPFEAAAEPVPDSGAPAGDDQRVEEDANAGGTLTQEQASGSDLADQTERAEGDASPGTVPPDPPASPSPDPPASPSPDPPASPSPDPPASPSPDPPEPPDPDATEDTAEQRTEEQPSGEQQTGEADQGTEPVVSPPVVDEPVVDSDPADSASASTSAAAEASEEEQAAPETSDSGQ